MVRQLVCASLAVPLFAYSTWAQSSMAAAGKAVGLNIGAATNSNQLTGTSTYITNLKAQFNMVVCENEMKFQPTEGSRGKFSYRGGDGVSDFAKANGMAMRGHTFIWHSQSGWAANITGKAEILNVMKTHIDSVGGHFKDKILEWDVLNEITSDAGNGLRGTFWQAALGNDLPDTAFAYAHRVIGEAGHLYYNDYGAEGLNAKSNSIYNLAKRLVEAKAPIDGIGLQCHLSAGLNAKDISSNIKRLGELGLRVSMTEIDIKNGKTADWVNLMNACLENFNCVSFVTWGVDDSRSWIGSNCDCLLYNNNQPKAHIQALIEALGKADPTVTAKRKEFIAKGATRVAHPLQNARRMAAGNLLRNASSMPVFSVSSGAVLNILGRNQTSPALSH